MPRGGKREGAGRPSIKAKEEVMNAKLGRIVVDDDDVSFKNACHDALKKFQTIMRQEKIRQSDAMALKSIVTMFNYFLPKLEKSEARVTKQNMDFKALMLGVIDNSRINRRADGIRPMLTRGRSKSIKDSED